MTLDNFDRKMERRFGRFAVRNLSLALIICYFFGYLISYVNPAFLKFLTLNPYAIVHGQIWRIFTWIIMPPEQENLFFVLIMMLFYYSIGTALERIWGTWHYNEYMFMGFLFTVIGSFVMMGWAYAFHGEAIASMGASAYFAAAAHYFSTYYVNMSIFLAYAAAFPDMQVLLMFFIPVRVKYLGVVYAVFLVIDAFSGNYITRIALFASLLNFLIFFLRSRNMSRISPREMKRKADWRRATGKSERDGKTWSRGQDGWMHAQNSGEKNADTLSGRAQTSRTDRDNILRGNFRKPIHRCAVCGRTEFDDPNLEFRYCSKCEGNYEYCTDHIFMHVHVRAGDPSCFDADGHVKMIPGMNKQDNSRS